MPFVSSSGDIAETLSRALSTLSNLAENASLKKTAEEGRGTSEPDFYPNEIQRLQIWSRENGASEGILDHRLRESTPLRKRVLSLLVDLSEVKDKESSDPTEILQTTSPTSLSPGLNTIIQERDGHLPQPLENNFDPFRTSTIETSSVGKISSSPSLDFDIALKDSFSGSSTTFIASQVHLIITLLFELGQTLRDPAPTDRLDEVQYPGAVIPDLDHARNKFPKANEEVVKRLGFANWERRRMLRRLKEDFEKVSNVVQSLGTTQLTTEDEIEEEDSDADDLSISDTSHEAAFTSTRSTATTKTGSNFNFSGRGTKSSTATTVPSMKQVHRSPMASSIDGKFKIPPPPEPNSNFDGEVFLCPYCFHFLSEIKSRLQWRKHVFIDLKPYMCMYSNCIQRGQAYADSRSWWGHEIARHRTQRSWECGPCGQDGRKSKFETIEDFENHIPNEHPTASARDTLRSITKACETRIGVSKPSSICPLCLEDVEILGSKTRFDPERSMRRHVSDHLEQLALFVALPAGEVSPEGDDSEFIDDSDSETGPRTVVESIMSDDRVLSRQQVGLVNVKNFLSHQRDTPNLPSRRPILDYGGAKIDIGNMSKDTVHKLSYHPMNSNREEKQLFPIQVLMHPPNEHFYGREEVLSTAHSIFGKLGSICVVYGLGGVGKTHTAIEYAYRYRDSFEGIFWLQADTAPGLSDSYVQMATAIGMAQGTEDQVQITDRGRSWLQETEKRWLLIFDNVESWDAISPYLPNALSRTKGSVLLTTQSEKLIKTSGNVTKIEVKSLDPDAGSEMLLRYMNKDPETDPERYLAREISTFVGGLPVAIAHVAGYAEFARYTLDELLQTFREWRRKVGVATDEADDLPAAFRQQAFSYEEILDMVWNVTLRDLNRDCQDLMYILAYLNCEAVPESMIWSVHEEPSLHFLDIRETMRSRNVKKNLIGRRLVSSKDVDGELCFSIHRSLQRSIRQTLSHDIHKEQLVFSQAVALVREVFPRSSPVQQPTPGKWSEFQRLLPHLHALHDTFYSAKPRIKGSIDFAQILSDAGMDQNERGLTEEGLLLLKTAEDVLDSISSADQDRLRADIHAMIGIMYDNTGIGRRQEALDRRKVALKLRQKVLDESTTPRREDEVLVYNSWMEYAISLLHYHRYEEAEPMIEKCLVKFREWGDEAQIPFEYAKYYNKIGLVRMYQGRFPEAVDYAEQGVLHMSKTGYDLFETRFKFDLACILLQSGDVDRSLKLHREIYDSRLEKLGNSNELTLHSRYAIGAIHEIKGQAEEAEVWFRRALDQRRGVSQWPEEAVSRAQFHLAHVLRLQGDPKDVEYAEELHRKALAVLHKLLPLDHPPELKSVTDEAVLFDHMLTISGARFTGQGLLRCFMKKSI